MKRWICCLLASLFLLLVFPPAAVSAAAGGELALKGNDITVTLRKPEGVTEAVTSLRFWMYVAVTEGEMAQPEFQFTDDAAEGGIRGSVKDAAITKQGNRYVIDLIVSGKQDQDIFRGGSLAVIGTLSLRPASQKAQADVGVAGEAAEEGSQPALKYTSRDSQGEQAVFLLDMKPVTYSGSVSDLPPAPNVPVSPDKNPDAGFSKDTAPKLKLRVKNTTKQVSFSWKQITGADGYKIYQYQEDTGKYKRVKTISKAGKTTYAKKMEFGTAYKFRMRAFQNQQDGTKTYGAYSAVKQVTTAPAKVKGLDVQKQGYAKTILSWNQVEPSEGYQVFQSTDKNGVYSRIKTIPKGDVCRYSIKNPPKGKMFYKVRAYVVKADGKRKFGAFSGIKS